MKILGIDPGYGILGWAVIEESLKIIDCGKITSASNLRIDERLFIVHNDLQGIIYEYKPDCLAIERLFFAKNTKTAIDVAKCIGAVLLTARLNSLDFMEYTPIQVKSAITGYGRATKAQMQAMVKKIFCLKKIPGPDDVADALAVAACHSLNRNINKITAKISK